MDNNTSSFYKVDRFADIEVLRYKVPGFEDLPLKQKLLVYHLSEAAIEGRDILFDQNNRHNLFVRKSLETVYTSYTGNTDCEEFKAFECYLKQIWFSNGIHHHYSTNKHKPSFSEEYLTELLDSAGFDGDRDLLRKMIFDGKFDAKRVNLAENADVIATSANNYYRNVSQKEAEDFYAAKQAGYPDGQSPSFGLNSRLEKVDGRLKEKVWKVGGLYSEAIEWIVSELEKAVPFAENDKQAEIIETLIAYYCSGDLKTFDAYSILWVEDTESQVDFVNGFIETYGDALGLKASWESTVNFRNEEATRRTQTISENAQWFEDHSPVDVRFKKKEVKGVSAKVITVAMLGGDCYPSTPIGINLPNADWIRRDHGSKSVTIENIMEAYDKASQGNGFSEEFVWSDTERNRIRQYGFITDVLHTDLHECLGHGSGQLLPGTDPDALKAYASTLEEARADLFGLYYLADPKLVELGLVPDTEAYKAEYYKYMMNGLMTQLVRIELGKDVEEAHMRNRQLIARWAFEQGKSENVVELKLREGKTFVVVNDYEKLRALFGKLLAEVQRIKSEGDYEAGRALVENYGVKIDPALHREVRERYEQLHLSPYKGFVNPVMHVVKDENDAISDITLDYTENYVEQMLRYSENYSFLRS